MTPGWQHGHPRGLVQVSVSERLHEQKHRNRKKKRAHGRENSDFPVNGKQEKLVRGMEGREVYLEQVKL